MTGSMHDLFVVEAVLPGQGNEHGPERVGIEGCPWQHSSCFGMHDVADGVSGQGLAQRLAPIIGQRSEDVIGLLPVELAVFFEQLAVLSRYREEFYPAPLLNHSEMPGIGIHILPT